MPDPGGLRGAGGNGRADPKEVLRDLARSATTTGEPSWPTRNVLLEHGLFERSSERPEAVIAELHKAMINDRRAIRLLFALAELSYLHGQQAARAELPARGAVYAYAFLFPEGDGATPGRFDPRLRIAADLYNWALTAAFASEDGSEVVPRGGTFELPFGQIEVAFDPAALRAGDRELYRFIPIAELEVHGMAMRYRWPGLGAPLAASSPADRHLEARPRPGGAAAAGAADRAASDLRRPTGARARRAAHGHAGAAPGLGRRIGRDRRRAGAARERADRGAGAHVHRRAGHRKSRCSGSWADSAGLLKDRPPLVSTTPYRPGLIPVVFVHGTASSIVRWAEMYNRLPGRPRDPQPLPVLVLPVRLRQSHRPVCAPPARGADRGGGAARPRGQGPGPAADGADRPQPGRACWSRCRASAAAIGSGTRPAAKPLDELELSDETRDLFRRGLFVEPVPGVSRVVFVCTPHRGSFVAGRNVIANLSGDA